MILAHFRWFQVVLAHKILARYADGFSLFQMLLACFKSFQVVLDRFRSIQLIPHLSKCLSPSVFLYFVKKYNIVNIKILTFSISPLQHFFNEQLFFNFINKCQTEILRSALPSLHVFDFFFQDCFCIKLIIIMFVRIFDQECQKAQLDVAQCFFLQFLVRQVHWSLTPIDFMSN